MQNRYVVEYYNGENLVVRIASSIVPPVGSKISIRGKTWGVARVTFAIDHVEKISERSTRANVDLQEC